MELDCDFSRSLSIDSPIEKDFEENLLDDDQDPYDLLLNEKVDSFFKEDDHQDELQRRTFQEKKKSCKENPTNKVNGNKLLQDARK